MRAAPWMASILASVSTVALAQTTAPAEVTAAPPAETTIPPGQAGDTSAVAPPSAGPETQEGGLQDIVVTARKRVESLQNVPVAVTALSAEQLDNQNVNSLERLGALAPQLTIARSATGSGAQITLRGIGSNPGSLGIEQSVAVIVDGVYYGQGRTINEGLFDLAGMEILKGPQSLFYGKNATAGVISITSADPSSTFSGRIKAGYEFNAQQIYSDLILSGPLTDSLGYRVAVRGAKMFGGYIRNNSRQTSFNIRDVATGALIPTTAAPGFRDTPKQEDIIARGTLQWQAADRLTATLKASYNLSNTNNPAWNGVIAECANGFSFFDRVTPCERKFTVYQNRFPLNVAASFPNAKKDGATFNEYHSYSATGTLNYDGESVNINGVVNWNRNVNKLAVDADNQSFGPINVYATEVTSFRALSGEVRALTTYDGPVNLLVGAYYQNTKRVFDQAAFSGNLANSAAFDPQYTFVAFAKNSETEGETLSGYGQAIWKIVPTLEATAGVRYIHETKDSYFTQPYINPALQFRFVQGNFITADQTFNNWSPEATLTWRPNESITTYIDYKTAYKSGGFSNSALDTVLGSPSDLVFAPEKARGFEGGIKTTLADRQLRLNLAAYSYKYTNFQIDFQNSQTFAFITTNAGSVRARGVELDAQFSPRSLPGFETHGTLNWSRARYIDFLAPCYSGESLAAGCNTTFRGGLGQRLDGKPTTNAPTWTASLGTSYEQEVGGGSKLLFTIDSRYSSSYFASAFNSPLSKQGKYINLDASVRFSTAEDRLEFAIVGKNLTNRFIVTGAQDSPSTGSGTGTAAAVLADQRSYVALPRTVQAEVTWNF